MSPRVNFGDVEDIEELKALRRGTYLCEVTDVEEAETKYCDELWKLTLTVMHGEYEGRKIFDNLVFSEAAMKRAKLVCSSLGLDVEGEVELTPKLITGRKCSVTVKIEDYESAEGKTQKRNVVLFAGYAPPANTGLVRRESDSQDDLPF